jgi:hypothetical protein
MLGPNDLCPICFNTGYTKNFLGQKIPCSNDCKARDPETVVTKEPEKVETPPPPPPQQIPMPPSLGVAKEAISESIEFNYNLLPITYEIIPHARNPHGTPFLIEEFWLWYPCLESAPIELNIEANCVSLFKGHAAVFLAGPVKIESVISTYSPLVINFKKAADYQLSVTTMHAAVVMRGVYQPMQYPPFVAPLPSYPYPQPGQPGRPYPQPGQWTPYTGNGGYVTITGGTSGGLSAWPHR